MHTGQKTEISPEIETIIQRLKPSLEEYLPDEKISRKWEEVEVISEDNPDFETVFWRYDLDDVLIVISEEKEFFPAYVVSLCLDLGSPLLAQQGTMKDDEFIGIEADLPVHLFGFCDPSLIDRMRNIAPSLESINEVTISDLENMIKDVIDDL
ncbi:MAG: hypothetical protein ACXAE3_03265 [Candidatus Kariarchaeaceae archaeon]|jgi:hypothetical protein